MATTVRFELGFVIASEFPEGAVAGEPSKVLGNSLKGGDGVDIEIVQDLEENLVWEGLHVDSARMHAISAIGRKFVVRIL